MEEAVSATIAPEKILRELAALWREEGKAGGTGVLRACSMTLLVIEEPREDDAALGETIAALMPEHPSRAIFIRLSGAGPRALSERVYQQCWMPFGQRRQICCEQIEIVASDAALGDLPSVALPLIVPDLPVILWCRSPRLVGMPQFAPLAQLATKIVVDSAAFPDPTEALSKMADAVRGGRMMADLAWTRLTRCRETLARTFDDREHLARLGDVSEVNVAYGEGSQTAACYLAAWVANALADAGIKIKVKVTRGSESLDMELAGADVRVALACEGDALAVTVGAVTTRTNLPHPSEYLLMREELGIVRRDTVFERTLAFAVGIAVSSTSEPRGTSGPRAITEP